VAKVPAGTLLGISFGASLTIPRSRSAVALVQPGRGTARAPEQCRSTDQLGLHPQQAGAGRAPPGPSPKGPWPFFTHRPAHPGRPAPPRSPAIRPSAPRALARPTIARPAAVQAPLGRSKQLSPERGPPPVP